MRTIAYYVSGHGFGHARRAAALLRALVAGAADVRVVVRTSAPAGLFEGIPNVVVSAPAESFDPGVVERDALTVDAEASVRRLADVLGRKGAIVAAEAAFLKEVGARVVVADVPFLAGDAAEAAGVPCVAVGNFTWDWIYEGFGLAEVGPLVEEIRASYRRMRRLYQLPLGHEVTCFKEVVAVPLLAERSVADRSETLKRLGVDEEAGQLRVLVATRGGLAPETLRRAAADSPGTLFFANQAVAGAPANLRDLGPMAGAFTDVLATCDVVVSKLGYGIVSDCLANGVALLYPPRNGFREDEVSERVAPAYMKMRRIEVEDFRAGQWWEGLAGLLHQSAPVKRKRVDGAEVIAGLLQREMGGA